MLCLCRDAEVVRCGTCTWLKLEGAICSLYARCRACGKRDAGNRCAEGEEEREGIHAGLIGLLLGNRWVSFIVCGPYRNSAPYSHEEGRGIAGIRIISPCDS